MTSATGWKSPPRPAEGEMTTMMFREMDDQVTYTQQLQQDDGPVVLINQFNLAPGDTERFVQVWADDAAYMKQQPGFIATQLHRGTAGRSARPSSRPAPHATPTAPPPPRTCSPRSPSRASAWPSITPRDCRLTLVAHIAALPVGRRCGVRATCVLSAQNKNSGDTRWGASRDHAEVLIHLIGWWAAAGSSRLGAGSRRALRGVVVIDGLGPAVSSRRWISRCLVSSPSPWLSFPGGWPVLPGGMHCRAPAAGCHLPGSWDQGVATT